MTEGFGFNMAYTAIFEGATATYDFSRGAEALKVFAKGKSPEVLQPPGGDGYLGELRYFLDSIRAERRPTVVTAADGVSAVEICEAEEESVRTGRIVELPRE